MKFEEIQYQWTLDCVMDETELSHESIKIPQQIFNILFQRKIKIQGNEISIRWSY
jgi:hypothetical protein